MLDPAPCPEPHGPGACRRDRPRTPGGNPAPVRSPAAAAPPAWLAILALVLALGDSPAALALTLESPLLCDPPESCHVQNHVDLDPGPGHRDPFGGAVAYDGHNGTDFRVPVAAMRAGAVVRAAAPGRVAWTVDGVPDKTLEQAALSRKNAEGPGPRASGPDPARPLSGLTGQPRNLLPGHEANAVALDHGDGWMTYYGHLRNGSVAVRQGQEVAAGEPLGLVGLSGRTTFPHLHFQVQWQHRPVDPFTGLFPDQGSPGGSGPALDGPGGLWTGQALALWPVDQVRLLSHGFAPDQPDLQAILEERPGPDAADPLAPALVFWVMLQGQRAGDELELSVLDPGGQTLYARRQVYDQPGNVTVEYAGRLRGTLPAWPAGTYTGRWTLRRPQAQGAAREFGREHTLTMPGNGEQAASGP